MNILVAEDEAIALKRSKYFLEKWGHSVITVQNGLEALEEFLSSKIDLVITDWTPYGFKISSAPARSILSWDS